MINSQQFPLNPTSQISTIFMKTNECIDIVGSSGSEFLVLVVDGDGSFRFYRLKLGCGERPIYIYIYIYIIYIYIYIYCSSCCFSFHFECFVFLRKFQRKKVWSHSHRQCLSYLFGLTASYRCLKKCLNQFFHHQNTNIRYQYYWLYHNLIFSITLSTVLNFITSAKDRLKICGKLILIYIM
jgi:hypothetical protein